MKDYKLTLGPCLFNWKVNDWRDFYFKIAEESCFDEVYIGEVVCYKRYPFFEVALNEVVDKLISCGKIVHLSTFSLILSELEMNVCKKLITMSNNKKAPDNSVGIDLNNAFNVEVNDVGLLGLLANKNYIVGPTVNVYNEDTMMALIKQGASRFCFPYEIDKQSLENMGKVVGAEKEIFAFGRMPLAIAARCYHARIHGTTKDDCRYVCEKDYNGKVISTLADENFLTVNGTQTMSYSYVNLIRELFELKNMGVNIFRISPHFMDMVKIANIFKDVLEQKISGEEGYNIMVAMMPDAQSKTFTKEKNIFSNGFYFGTEGRMNIKGRENSFE